MSKSLGNFFTVRDISKEYDLMVVRLFMLSAHYRNPVNFSRDLIDQAKSALERLKNAKSRMEDTLKNGTDARADDQFLSAVDQRRQDFIDAMDDDLNTADAIGALFELVRETNTRFSEPRGKAEAQKALDVFNELVGVLGILPREEEVPAELVRMAEERQEARKQKDWKRADELRDKIAAAGYLVEDTPTGPKVKRA